MIRAVALSLVLLWSGPMPFGSCIADVFSEGFTGPIIDDFENARADGVWNTSSSGLEYSGDFVGSLDTVLFGSGYMRLTTTDPTGNAQASALMESYDDVVPWRNYPITMLGEGVFSFLFRTNSIRDANRDRETIIDVQHFVSNDLFTNTWRCRLYVSNYNDPGDEEGTLEVSGGSNIGNGDKMVKIDWIADTWYRVDVLQEGDHVSARVYVDGGAVPGWQVTDPLEAGSENFPWTFVEGPNFDYASLEWRQLEVWSAHLPTDIGILDIDEVRFDPS